jgi:hypothetical protein
VTSPRTLIAACVALIVLAAIVLGGLALAGSDDDDTTASPAPRDAVEAPTETAEPNALGSLPPEFVRCMADQGVAIESPDDFHKPEAQQAFPACLQFLHAGGAP